MAQAQTAAVQMVDAQTVTVAVTGGPSMEVPWAEGMNAQQALEAAWRQVHDTNRFTYGLQYFGEGLGYLVFMLNQTYDTFAPLDHPYFFWEFLVNGTPADKGIDGVTLRPGDQVGFRFQTYDSDAHAGTPLQAKHDALHGKVGARP